MIRETFARLFSGKKAKKDGPGLNADMYESRPANVCPNCNSPEIKKTVWRRMGFQPRTTTRMAADRYGLTNVIEWKCICGFTHTGSLLS